jgi:hypothetical protein
MPAPMMPAPAVCPLPMVVLLFCRWGASPPHGARAKNAEGSGSRPTTPVLERPELRPPDALHGEVSLLAVVQNSSSPPRCLRARGQNDPDLPFSSITLRSGSGVGRRLLRLHPSRMPSVVISWRAHASRCSLPEPRSWWGGPIEPCRRKVIRKGSHALLRGEDHRDRPRGPQRSHGFRNMYESPFPFGRFPRSSAKDSWFFCLRQPRLGFDGSVSSTGCAISRHRGGRITPDSPMI